MQLSWSLILNILLLIGVIMAITRLIKLRSQYLPNKESVTSKPQVKHFDEIISVRKVKEEPIVPVLEKKFLEEKSFKEQPSISLVNPNSKTIKPANKTIMLFLLAKENRFLAGYELLQTVLAAGLRFGEGQLFHRHQHVNGQGPVLCSLAAATESGIFDLQNIGAFSVRGLWLFMQASGNASIDCERFAIMVETAYQLSEGLDTHLLDDKKRPLSEENINRYKQSLNITSE